ncbi:MAG: polyprenol monophosphomannose synthase [Bacteroidales bacterium]
MSDSLVIIPTYKEKENIERIIRKVFSLEKEFNILIVEDNSPDGTADIVRSLMAEFPGRLFMEERKGKLGLGTAYIHGFRWALDRGYEFIFEMDADFSHNPDDLLRLYDAAKNKGADVAIGSRYITGVNVVNWPMSRLLLSYFANWFARIVTGIPVQDCTGGYKCFRRSVLEALDFNAIASSGYSFQIEVNFFAWQKGFRIAEVPIVFTDRKLGVSKMSSKIIREAFLLVIWKLFFASFLKGKR